MTLVHGGHSSQSPCTKTCPLRLVLQIGVHRVATNDPYAPRSTNTLDAFCPKSCDGVRRNNPVREISPKVRMRCRNNHTHPGNLPGSPDGSQKNRLPSGFSPQNHGWDVARRHKARWRAYLPHAVAHYNLTINKLALLRSTATQSTNVICI